MNQFKKQEQPKPEERKMDYADYRKVEEKVDSFAPRSDYPPYRWQEFLAHCGAGELTTFAYPNGHVHVACAVYPGEYQLWLERIRYYERSGGKYHWAKKPDAPTAPTVPAEPEAPVDNPFDFLSN